MRILTSQEAKDVLVGCTILGTGGGGELQLGLDAIDACYRGNKPIKLVPLDAIDDHSHYITTAIVGALSDESVMSAEYEVELLMSAIRALEEHLGIEFAGVVSSEYGGGNTGESMAAAAMLGKCFVDADAAGRAVPTMQLSTYNLTGQPICPFAAVSKHGDTLVVTKVQNDERAEDLCRSISLASGNLVAIADHPIVGKNLKDSVIPSALSFAEKLGTAQRQALEAGRDPVAEIVAAADGYLLFSGIVGRPSSWELRDGFTIGSLVLTGSGSFAGKTFELWYQNEHLISWMDRQVYVTCPDLLCVVDRKSGQPITNPNCGMGDHIAVIGLKSHEIWRSERGLELLSPSAFDFDFPYRPIEEVVAAMPASRNAAV